MGSSDLTEHELGLSPTKFFLPKVRLQDQRLFPLPPPSFTPSEGPLPASLPLASLFVTSQPKPNGKQFSGVVALPFRHQKWNNRPSVGAHWSGAGCEYQWRRDKYTAAQLHLTHTHTHTRTCAHTHMQAHTHIRTHTHGPSAAGESSFYLKKQQLQSEQMKDKHTPEISAQLTHFSLLFLIFLLELWDYRAANVSRKVTWTLRINHGAADGNKWLFDALFVA